jgi:hypothetical protein
MVDFHSIVYLGFRVANLLILKFLPVGGFFAHSDLDGLNQLVWAGNSRRNNHFSGGFLVYKQVIPSGPKTIPTDEGECWQFAGEKSYRW